MVRMDATEFAILAKELSAAPTLDQTAEQAVEHARTALGADHGSITLLAGHGRLQTVAPTDHLAVEADLFQYELREGPCVDSAWHGPTLASQNLADDPRWPNWAPRAAQLGIISVLAAELTADDDSRRLGALNLFWTSPTTFTTDDLAYASIFATHAAVALNASIHATHLNTALDARKAIGQAQGILMERFDLSAEQAFEVLRRYSQNHNLKLRHVAQQLVSTRQLP